MGERCMAKFRRCKARFLGTCICLSLAFVTAGLAQNSSTNTGKEASIPRQGTVSVARLRVPDKARDQLMNERPSPRVIDAVVGVADEEAIVFLARIGRAHPELAFSILSALDEIDHTRAAAAASGLRYWLSLSK